MKEVQALTLQAPLAKVIELQSTAIGLPPGASLLELNERFAADHLTEPDATLATAEMLALLAPDRTPEAIQKARRLAARPTRIAELQRATPCEPRARARVASPYPLQAVVCDQYQHTRLTARCVLRCRFLRVLTCRAAP